MTTTTADAAPAPNEAIQPASSSRKAKDIVPMKRAGTPQEVAALASFLVSDEAAYITGQVISINGGMI